MTLLVFIGSLLGAMAIGVILGRKPIAGSCGGLATLGDECEFGCKKPCSKRAARLKASTDAAS